MHSPCPTNPTKTDCARTRPYTEPRDFTNKDARRPWHGNNLSRLRIGVQHPAALSGKKKPPCLMGRSGRKLSSLARRR